MNKKLFNSHKRNRTDSARYNLRWYRERGMDDQSSGKTFIMEKMNALRASRG